MKLNRLTLSFLALAGTAFFNFDLFAAEKPTPENEAKEFFVQKVKPLLQNKCFGCHGEDKDNIQGELNLTTREGLLKGGESERPSIVPGKPDESPLFRAILREDEDFKMPPKDRNALSKDEIEIVRQWILSGAPWATAKLIPLRSRSGITKKKMFGRFSR